MARLAKCLTLAQVMISWFMSSIPASGSVLTPQCLEPASDSVSPSVSLSAPPLLILCLALKNKHFFFILKKELEGKKFLKEK